MRRLGLRGVIRGKPVKTTISDKAQPCPLDRVNRQFHADRPNALWVSDFTYVSTWQGMVYVAFVVDVYARRIVGWKASTLMTTDFVLDALEQALHARKREGELIHHSDRGGAIREHPLQRAPGRGRDRTVGGQRGGFLRQRAGRDDQRAVQGRGDPSPVMAQPRAGGTGHAGLGALVQPQAIAGADRACPASGSRSGLLSATHRSGQGGLTQTKRPPRKSGRFSVLLDCTDEPTEALPYCR